MRASIVVAIAATVAAPALAYPAASRHASRQDIDTVLGVLRRVSDEGSRSAAYPAPSHTVRPSHTAPSSHPARPSHTGRPSRGHRKAHAHANHGKDNHHVARQDIDVVLEFLRRSDDDSFFVARSPPENGKLVKTRPVKMTGNNPGPGFTVDGPDDKTKTSSSSTGSKIKSAISKVFSREDGDAVLEFLRRADVDGLFEARSPPENGKLVKTRPVQMTGNNPGPGFTVDGPDDKTATTSSSSTGSKIKSAISKLLTREDDSEWSMEDLD